MIHTNKKHHQRPKSNIKVYDSLILYMRKYKPVLLEIFHQCRYVSFSFPSNPSIETLVSLYMNWVYPDFVI